MIVAKKYMGKTSLMGFMLKKLINKKYTEVNFFNSGSYLSDDTY